MLAAVDKRCHDAQMTADDIQLVERGFYTSARGIPSRIAGPVRVSALDGGQETARIRLARCKKCAAVETGGSKCAV